MEGLKELCRELGEKRGKNQKEIARELDIPFLTFKSYLYKKANPKDKRVAARIKRYFERELAKPSVEKKPEIPLKGISKRLQEVVLEIGQGNARVGINTIKKEMGISDSSFNNWYYQGYVPKKHTLEKLASYLSSKLGRKITPEYLLGAEEKEEPKKIAKPKKEKPKKIAEPEKREEEKPTKEALIKMAEALLLKIKEYGEGEKGIILSKEEIELVNKFRQLSNEAKKGLMLFLK